MSSYFSSISSAQLMDQGSSCVLATLTGGLASLDAFPRSVAGGPWSSSKRYSTGTITAILCIGLVVTFIGDRSCGFLPGLVYWLDTVLTWPSSPVFTDSTFPR